MPRIKSAAEIAEKFARVAPGRQEDYVAGISDPGVDWAKPTSAASATYEQGVQDAISRGAFQKGVDSVGTDKWRRKTAEVGTQRWGPGVRAARNDYETGFAPYRDVIERTALPPRAPRGDPRNIERVAAVAMAQAALKRRR